MKEIQKRKNELKSAIKNRADILTSIAVSNALVKNVPVKNIPLEFNVSDILGNSKNLVTSAGQVTAKAMEKITVVVNVPTKELATATVTTGVGVNLITGGSSGDSNLEKVKMIDSSNDKLEEARIKGKEGELYAGIDPNVKKQTIDSLTETAKYRIPDYKDDVEKILKEVKNVKRQSYTNQIKDFNLYAQREGYKFQLVIKKGAKLTKPLKEEIEKGNIILKYIGE